MFDNYENVEPIVYKQLRNALNGNLSHAYLFDTNSNVYANKIVMAFIKALLCKNHSDEKEYLKCELCKRIEDGNYQELKHIYADGLYIKKEEIDNLQKEFSTKAIEGNKKIYVIHDAEKLNISAANSLLKFLEEPPEGIIGILLTNNSRQVLNTITSRCQIIKFSKSKLEDYILANNITEKLTLNKLNYSVFDSDNIDYLNEFIENLIDFWKTYEENKVNMIIYEKGKFLDKFDDKDKILKFINCSILLYRDIINLKLNRKIIYYEDYVDVLNKISNNNKLEKLLHKLDILLEKEKLIRKNVNLNMFIDGIIIDMEE